MTTKTKTPFLTRVQTLQRVYGYTRKIAVLITRIERGVETLDEVANLGHRKPFLTQAEYMLIDQHLSWN